VSKTSPPLSFQPAPRPQTRLNAADAAKLAEVTADLGFGRPVSAPEGPSEPHGGSPTTPPRPAPHKPSKTPAPAAADSGATSLKIDVPDTVWTTLKMEAVRRRVTVKFLVLEALSHQGYEIDLANVPEDGRRLR
jgi:hypothetical protein